MEGSWFKLQPAITIFWINKVNIQSMVWIDDWNITKWSIVAIWITSFGSSELLLNVALSLKAVPSRMLICSLLTLQIRPTSPGTPQWPSSHWAQGMTWRAVYAGEEVRNSFICVCYGLFSLCGHQCLVNLCRKKRNKMKSNVKRILKSVLKITP